jgi:hypothetical protein
MKALHNRLQDFEREFSPDSDASSSKSTAGASKSDINDDDDEQMIKSLYAKIKHLRNRMKELQSANCRFDVGVAGPSASSPPPARTLRSATMKIGESGVGDGHPGPSKKARF